MRLLAALILLTACATNEAAVPAAPVVALDPCSIEGYRSSHPGTLGEQARGFIDACRRVEVIALGKKLISFPTISSEQTAADGPAFAAMRAYLEEWSKSAGLEMRTFGKNDAWVISYGAGAPSVGFVMHADVVPVNEEGKPAVEGLPPGWTVPPFEATEKDERIYGRGSEDDKLPIATALIVLKTLKDFGYRPQGALQVIMGTGEEHDWDGMVAYAKTEPHPRYTISADAEFPVVVAESGFVAWKLSLPLASKAKPKKGCLVAKDVRGGQFLTQVPGDATLTLSGDLGKIDQAAIIAAGKDGASLEVATTKGGGTIKATGVAVHSSVAEEGKNALWSLSAAAAKLPLCEGGIASMLNILAEQFAGDHYGEKLGVAYKDELMGPLLVIPTVLRVENDQVTLAINMRRPAGMSSPEFGARLDAAKKRLEQFAPGLTEAPDRWVGEPHLSDTKGPLVSTLLGIYRQERNDPTAKETVIRGGTYARLFPGAVSFGPALPGTPYRGHAPDEYIALEAVWTLVHTQLAAVLQLDVAPATVTAK